MWNDNDLKLRLERLGYQSIQIERSDHGLDDDSETQVSGRRHVDEHWVHYQETVRFGRGGFRCQEAWRLASDVQLPRFRLSDEKDTGLRAAFRLRANPRRDWTDGTPQEPLGTWWLQSRGSQAQTLLSTAAVRAWLQRFRHLELGSDGRSFVCTSRAQQELKRRQGGALRALFNLGRKQHVYIARIHEDICGLLVALMKSLEANKASG